MELDGEMAFGRPSNGRTAVCAKVSVASQNVAARATQRIMKTSQIKEPSQNKSKRRRIRLAQARMRTRAPPGPSRLMIMASRPSNVKITTPPRHEETSGGLTIHIAAISRRIASNRVARYRAGRRERAKPRSADWRRSMRVGDGVAGLDARHPQAPH